MLKAKILGSISIPSGIGTEVTHGEDPTFAKKVQFYKEWLADDAARNRIANSAKRIDEYQHVVALSSTIVNGQEIVTFAPFQEHLSALQTTKPKQRFVLWAIFVVL